jgi:hypothetical protein
MYQWKKAIEQYVKDGVGKSYKPSKKLIQTKSEREIVNLVDFIWDHVETFLKKYLIENPFINEIWISSDNGRHFTGNFFLIGLMLLVEKFSTPERKLVFHFIKSEPDTKSTLDCHFSFISMVIHNFKQINDLNNAEDVFLH